MIVIDTSVIVKWFSEEKYTEEALKIRERIRKKEEVGIFPDLLLYELSNALRYNPNFDEDDVKKAIKSVLESFVSLQNWGFNQCYRVDITLSTSKY